MRNMYIALLMCLVLSSFASATSQPGTVSTTFVAEPAVQTTATAEASPCSDIAPDMKACEANGLGYVIEIGADGCKSIKCTVGETHTCPADEEVERKIANCPDSYATTTDGYGCTYKYCYQQPTTTCPAVEEQIRKCKAAQLDYETYADDSGCKQVRCRNNEKVECKKYLENGCVIISCNDGYILNLCNYCGQQTCKVYTDDSGCTVKDCGDGQESRACPATAGGEVPTAVQTIAVAPTQTAQQEPQRVLKSKPTESGEQGGAEKPSQQETQPSPQPEPPKPAGFWGWVKGLFE
jgi:hypothetical protein